MRFFYKRQPADELELEIQDVRQAMCSGRLVLFDLFFYSLIFAILIAPVSAGHLQFGGIFLVIYLSFSCLFLFLSRTLNRFKSLNDYFQK